MLLYYRPNDMLRGPAVRRCQETCNAVLGKKALRCDSVFGPGTEKAVKRVQAKLKKRVDGVYGSNTHKACMAYLGKTLSTPKIYKVDGVKVVDAREADDYPPLTHHNSGVMRPWSQIRGVMLHQTGCDMPEDPNVWANVGTQCGITRKGVVMLMRPFELQIWHATVTKVSKMTIGIEIAGNMRGSVSAPYAEHTYWRPGGGPHKLLKCQVKAACVLFKLINEGFDKGGGTWDLVVGHRQTDHNREADPGEEIWRQIAIPWQKQLKATDGGQEEYWGRGQPIPTQWNPKYKHPYWR